MMRDEFIDIRISIPRQQAQLLEILSKYAGTTLEILIERIIKDHVNRAIVKNDGSK
jgi:hypothetical protein